MALFLVALSPMGVLVVMQTLLPKGMLHQPRKKRAVGQIPNWNPSWEKGEPSNFMAA
jgi:hypothetical protein